jgi:anhydro-N-acetylmuramic acid kinase
MLKAIGMMSGTSLDGVDLAMIETDGERRITLGPSASLDYGAADRDVLRRALVAATMLDDRALRPGPLREAEIMLTDRHADLVTSFLESQGLEPEAIDVVGFHGQTVLHRPEQRLTIQIGDAARLAGAIGIPVVHDFRAADIAAGGQGAPFVPIFHRALVEASGLDDPVAVVNLGGVGNITYVAAGADPIAFDTGPGNALIDDLMLERTGVAVDRDGKAALAGRADAAALSELMRHPYFAKAPPKSLDRNAFSRERVAGLATADAAATLAAFTAASVAAAEPFLPRRPAVWAICGGGARNPAILAALAECVSGRVVTADEVGWSSSMMEAQAFAYLAVRSLRGLPLSFPTTTGVPAPMPGGLLARPSGVAA